MGALKGTAITLWTNQYKLVGTLQNQPELTDDSCVFLFFLLCSLPTGPQLPQEAVEKIVSFPTNSLELPNDTFFNTLLYYVLMLWIDPVGNYKFNSDQIKSTLKSLDATLLNNDAGTQGIKASIEKNLQIINAAPTYPMMDPYNPGIGFNTRKPDILEAINSVWPCQ